MAKKVKEANSGTSDKKIMMVKVSAITPSPDNPRTVNRLSEKFKELVEHVAANGVLVPIHVREDPEGGWRLLAGERRWRAAGEAGLDEIQAIVHLNCTDEQAFEITFAENYAREDLTVLEQGKAVATLLEKYHGDAKAAASKLGKSERWLRLRQMIYSNLSDAWKEKIKELDGEIELSAAHLELIARYPKAMQEQMANSINNYELGLSVDRLAEKLAREFRVIEDAVFDKSQCEGCIKRTGCQPMLWADEPEKVSGKADQCVDRKCWKEKVKEHYKNYIDEQRKKHGELRLVTDDYWVGNELNVYGKVLTLSYWEKCKKSDDGAVAAIAVSYDRDSCDTVAGKVFWVKIVNPNTRNTEDDDDEWDGEQPDQKIQTAVELTEAVRALSFEKLIERFKISPERLILLMIAAWEQQEVNDAWFFFEKLGEMDFSKEVVPMELAQIIWDRFKSRIGSRMEWNWDFENQPQNYYEVKRLCMLLGRDVPKEFECLEEAAELAIKAELEANSEEEAGDNESDSDSQDNENEGANA